MRTDAAQAVAAVAEQSAAAAKEIDDLKAEVAALKKTAASQKAESDAAVADLQRSLDEMTKERDDLQKSLNDSYAHVTKTTDSWTSKMEAVVAREKKAKKDAQVAADKAAKEMSAAQDEIQALTASLTQAEAKAAAAEKQAKSISEAKEALELSLVDLEATKASSSTALESQVHDLQRKLREANEAAAQRGDELEAQLGLSRAAESELYTQASTLAGQLASALASGEAMGKELEAAQTAASAAAEERDVFRRERDEVQDERNALREETDVLRRERDAATAAAAAAAEGAAGRGSASDAEVASLKSSLQDALVTLTNKTAEYETNVSNLAAQIEAKEAEMARLRDELHTSQMAEDSLYSQLSVLSADRATSDAELVSVKLELSHTREALEDAHASFQAELAEAKALAEEEVGLVLDAVLELSAKQAATEAAAASALAQLEETRTNQTPRDDKEEEGKKEVSGVDREKVEGLEAEVAELKARLEGMIEASKAAGEAHAEQLKALQGGLEEERAGVAGKGQGLAVEVEALKAEIAKLRQDHQSVVDASTALAAAHAGELAGASEAEAEAKERAEVWEQAFFRMLELLPHLSSTVIEALEENRTASRSRMLDLARTSKSTLDGLADRLGLDRSRTVVDGGSGGGRGGKGKDDYGSGSDSGDGESSSSSSSSSSASSSSEMVFSSEEDEVLEAGVEAGVEVGVEAGVEVGVEAGVEVEVAETLEAQMRDLFEGKKTSWAGDGRVPEVVGDKYGVVATKSMQKRGVNVEFSDEFSKLNRSFKIDANVLVIGGDDVLYRLKAGKGMPVKDTKKVAEVATMAVSPFADGYVCITFVDTSTWFGQVDHVMELVARIVNHPKYQGSRDLGFVESFVYRVGSVEKEVVVRGRESSVAEVVKDGRNRAILLVPAQS